jgi:hypothetical protein
MKKTKHKKAKASAPVAESTVPDSRIRCRVPLHEATGTASHDPIGAAAETLNQMKGATLEVD